MGKEITEKLLADLFELTVAELIGRIKSGSATAAELSVARQLLKDNCITCGVNSAGDHPLDELCDAVGDDEVKEALAFQRAM